MIIYWIMTLIIEKALPFLKAFWTRASIWVMPGREEVSRKWNSIMVL